MKYDRDTMKSLQEAYNESKKLKDTGVTSKKQLEKIRTGLGAAVDQADLNVGYKEPKIPKSKKRIGEAIEMSRKDYKKTHKDFKSDDPKNPRVTRYVPGKGTVSTPVKLTDEVEKNCGCGETPCKTYSKQKEVEDMRSLPTRMNLIKTKLRAMGLNMSHELKGKELSEVIDYTLAELNRYERETGIDTKTGKKIVKGGTAKNDKAYQLVMKKYNPQRMGANEPKKNRGAKPDEGPGKYTIMLRKKRDQEAKNKAFAARAKAAGETPQQRADRIAIYGSEEDMEKGVGSGS